MINAFRAFGVRVAVLAGDESGMSTVEYSTGCKTYRERIP